MLPMTKKTVSMCFNTPLLASHTDVFHIKTWKKERKTPEMPTQWTFMTEHRFIPEYKFSFRKNSMPLEGNITCALFAWAGFWFIGTSVTYEILRCLHNPLLANLCYRGKIQKCPFITSTAGSIKTEVFWCRFTKRYIRISKQLGIMLQSILMSDVSYSYLTSQTSI